MLASRLGSEHAIGMLSRGWLMGSWRSGVPDEWPQTCSGPIWVFLLAFVEGGLWDVTMSPYLLATWQDAKDAKNCWVPELFISSNCQS